MPCLGGASVTIARVICVPTKLHPLPKLFLVVSTQRHAFVAGSHAYMSKPEPQVAAQLGASLIAVSSVAFSQIDAASLRKAMTSPAPFWPSPHTMSLTGHGGSHHSPDLAARGSRANGERATLSFQPLPVDPLVSIWVAE